MQIKTGWLAFAVDTHSLKREGESIIFEVGVVVESGFYIVGKCVEVDLRLHLLSPSNSICSHLIR